MDAGNANESEDIKEKKMETTNFNTQSRSGGIGIFGVNNAWRLLAGLLLIGLLAMSASFGTISANDGSGHQGAGDYTVSAPVLSGPPTTESGVTSIAGTVAVDLRGSQIGSALVTFTCDLGTGPKGANRCQGSLVFEGTLRGLEGSYQATMTNWIAGGEEAFTSSDYKLIKGSGTGELANLDDLEGVILRDEDAGLVGVYTADYKFEAPEIDLNDLSVFTLQELFNMEADGTISTEDLVAELETRAEGQ